MMDNSQGSFSDNVVNKADIKTESVDAFSPKDGQVDSKDSIVEKKEDKRVPLHELYKERNKRKALEEEVQKLRSKQDELESRFSKVSRIQEDDELVEEAEKELGIDKEAARKLLNLQKKVVERNAPKSKESTSVNDPVLRAMDDFKRRALEASQDYEDWNDMIPSMQAIMSKEIEQNGLGAYNKSPEYYYSKAVKAQKESESKLKKEIDLDKSNAINSSTVESGSYGAKAKGDKITQAIFDANRSNPGWVRENIETIKTLWREGKLK